MAKNYKILLVDDDKNFLQTLGVRFSAAGYDVALAASGQDALLKFKNTNFDLIITDLMMSGMNGLELITKARNIQPGVPVLIMSADASATISYNVGPGLLDWLVKPFDGHDLLYRAHKILKTKLQNFHNFDEEIFISDLEYSVSSSMKQLCFKVHEVALVDVDVLILGEKGVGKECVARIIHRLSRRRKQPFVVTECSSSPDSLLDCKLFGSKHGPFTPTIMNKPGLIDAANKGTLYFDEIRNLPIRTQVKLLKLIRDRKFSRIGDFNEISIDCRIFAATNTNMKDSVKTGKVRIDLYRQLGAVTMHIPKLSERKEDIPVLVHQFTRAKHNPYGTFVEVPKQTMDCLCKYSWPGHVRELKKVIDRGLFLCKNNILLPKNIHFSESPT